MSNNDTMEFTAVEKQELEQKIVDIITSSLEQKKVTEDELSPISTYVLNNIDTIKDREGLLYFLEQLSARWAIFDDLYELEKGGDKKKEDDQAVKNIEGLIESGNLDQALAVAKQATAQE